ncbi:MAG: aspartate kinase [Bacillota bacterium]
MKILVQKFGGTSVANQDRREMAADKIEGALNRGYFPVVVVSAIGRSGDPYATDTLINLAKSVNTETCPREMDLIMSCGEVISCVILAGTLSKRGHRVKVLTGGQAGIITDNNFGDAEVLRVEPKQIIKCVENSIIPIITGFQGITENGEITTLGRGAGDYSGAIVGEAVKAEAVEVYTDVDGVMTADPRIVPDARVMNTIFYNEVFQMAEYGAKVIHPRAVEVAMRSNIPLIIKNTMNDHPGTLVTNYEKANGSSKKDKSEKIITSVAYISNRVQVKVYFDGTAGEYEEDDYLFSLIADEDISLDMINVYPDHKVFIIQEVDLKRLELLLKARGIKYDVKLNCSKVTVIGNKMRGVPGVMAKVIRALSKHNIKLLQSSDSHTTISCLIENEFVGTAVNALHKEFELGKGSS